MTASIDLMGGGAAPASATAAAPRRKVMWLLDSLTMGGAESLVIPFAQHLDPARWELAVTTIGPGSGTPLEAEIRALGIPTSHAGARRLRDPEAFERLVNLVHGWKPDLLHAHLTYSSIWSAFVSRRTGTPTIASIHVAPSATRALRKGYRHALATSLRDWLMRKTLDRWSSRVLAVSDAVRREYSRRGGISEQRLQVLHNGIDVERFDRDRLRTRRAIEEEFSIPAGSRIAISVAVLRPRKGIEFLLESAKDFPDVIFLIVGDGPLREEWKQLATTLEVADRVRWAGFRRDLEAILPGGDVFVHPSLDDAFPTVLLEAMASALPVVATNVGGIPEIVREGRTGTMVPPSDSRALSNAIRSVLDDPLRAASMSEEARRIAVADFSTTVWISRLMAIYDDVVRRTEAAA